MLPKSDFVFVVIFRLRAESLASDSDHHFHAFERRERRADERQATGAGC
jgi:hypothetical protein